ncbi:hypothetical protein WG66_012763 [Moniliophthora roreri]|nr:hypothetical protein WG66_012763 [Moniliophthora roreri]
MGDSTWKVPEANNRIVSLKDVNSVFPTPNDILATHPLRRTPSKKKLRSALPKQQSHTQQVLAQSICSVMSAVAATPGLAQNIEPNGYPLIFSHCSGSRFHDEDDTKKPVHSSSRIRSLNSKFELFSLHTALIPLLSDNPSPTHFPILGLPYYVYTDRSEYHFVNIVNIFCDVASKRLYPVRTPKHQPPSEHALNIPSPIGLGFKFGGVQESSFTCRGKNTFTNVRGNQVNGNVYTSTVNFNTGPAAAKRTERDEFQYVRRGDMIATKEIHSKELSEWDWELQNGEFVGRYKSSTRKICTIEIIDRQSKYTAMIYEGKDAQDFLEKDFQLFSRNKKPGSFQLFGINQSAIPALIFHYELIPCAHFFNRKSMWMNVYIRHLTTNMDCFRDNIWMNTAGGVLFSGPDGPPAPVPRSDAVMSIVVPTTVDMLKDDTCFRFFINFGSSVDDSVLKCARWNSEYTYLDNLFPATAEDYQSEDSDHPNWSSVTHHYLRRLWRNPPDHLPMSVIGGLRFDTVYSLSMDAVARWPPGAGSLWEWEEYGREGLVEEHLAMKAVKQNTSHTLHRLPQLFIRSSHVQPASMSRGRRGYLTVHETTIQNTYTLSRSEAQWADILNPQLDNSVPCEDDNSINVFGALDVSRAFLPYMRERKTWTIVFMGYLSAGDISETLHEEIAPLGLRVSALTLATPEHHDPQRGVGVVLDIVRGEGIAKDKPFQKSIQLGSVCYAAAKVESEKAHERLEEWKEVLISTDLSKDT